MQLYSNATVIFFFFLLLGRLFISSSGTEGMYRAVRTAVEFVVNSCGLSRL